MSERNVGKKSERTSIRLPQRIMDMLDEAQVATGLDRTEIILKCIEAELPNVERREAERRLREAQEGYERVKARHGEEKNRLAQGQSRGVKREKLSGHTTG